ncbi:helix-turn-helix transcriptional regulator [Microbispora cellulosiformans]|uniref:Helix-turn-helix transcriptional regulator n=1 Tax=Microbispora cellulosiformans TaxID=2614688 RepID=A0A5J5JYG8_9ACTN|nr:helix-turn-helix transcriptional regulator [Microbispora cellulosiformans]KAA9375455.1 helix-turn-helix transcriptional regulator [Microbispora cellulosiformans]
MQQPAHFGQELRRLRISSNLSLSDLAKLVNYSKGQLSKVERGLKAPSRDLVRLCDAKLGAGGALARLVPVSSDPPADLATTDDADKEEVWLMRLSLDGQSWFQPVGRRQVLSLGAMSVAGMGIGVAGGSSAAKATLSTGSETVLEASRVLFDQYRRLGQIAHPTVVLPALIAQTHTLREVAADAAPCIRQGLLRLGSRYAEYAGWLVQETGNDEGALWWTRLAVELATAGGDRYLASYGLVRRALITLYQQDAAQTVGLARQAQTGVVPPRISGLAAQREAQGHAIACDYDACMRALDRSRVLLALGNTDSDEPAIGTTNLPDSVAMITGWCLYDLGRPDEAAALLDRELRQLAPQAVRARVRFGMRRALAYAAAGEVDHACALTRELIGDLVAVGSVTIASDLRSLARALNRHPKNVAVRDLSPELSAALRIVAL